MKTLLHLLPFIGLIFLLSLSQKLKAAEWAGGEITYRCVGNEVYEVTLRSYRDCAGSPVGAVTLQASCGSIQIQASNYIKVSTQDVTGIIANCQDSSICKGGSFPYGYEEHVWKATLDLSGQSCCNWELSWSECCRSSAISTGSAGEDLFVTASLNNCLAPFNSSPAFNETPQFIVCANQDVLIPFGASDSKDTLDFFSYHLVSGLKAQNQNITFSGSFSSLRPLTFWGFPNNGLTFPLGFTLDSLSGELGFRPTSVNQVASVTVLVKEWRTINGIVEEIGSIRRDVIIRTLSCPQNKKPTLNASFGVNACVGDRACLKIVTTDDDTLDSVSIYLEGVVLPNVSFTNNNGQSRLATGEICWTPDSSHIRNQPYLFYIKARDNACPFPGEGVKAYSFRVYDKPRADLDLKQFGCGFLSLNKTLKASTGSLSSKWEIYDSLNQGIFNSFRESDTTQLPQGKYVIKLTLKNPSLCSSDFTDTLEIGAYQANSQVLNLIQKGNELIADSGYVVYLWYDADNKLLQKSSQNKIYLMETGTYTVIAYDSLYCTKSSSAPIQVSLLGKNHLHNNLPKVSPNPVAVNAYLSLEGTEGVVNISDAFGRYVPHKVYCEDRNCKIIIYKQGLFTISAEDGSTYRVLVY